MLNVWMLYITFDHYCITSFDTKSQILSPLLACETANTGTDCVPGISPAFVDESLSLEGCLGWTWWRVFPIP